MLLGSPVRCRKVVDLLCTLLSLLSAGHHLQHAEGCHRRTHGSTPRHINTDEVGGSPFLWARSLLCLDCTPFGLVVCTVRMESTAWTPMSIVLYDDCIVQ